MGDPPPGVLHLPGDPGEDPNCEGCQNGTVHVHGR